MRRPDSLYLRHAANDLTKNKAVSVALVVVLTLSAFLMATGAMVMERLVGSVDQLFEEAKPPHFLQMHTGDHDPEALERFASEHPEVEAWHVVDMLGFDGPTVAWQRPATGESGDQVPLPAWGGVHQLQLIAVVACAYSVGDELGWRHPGGLNAGRPVDTHDVVVAGTA